MWCASNHRSFKDLDFDLVDYNELGDAVNAARSVFRRVGYQQLIPDALWEDLERRPKIGRHLILGVETCAMSARIAAHKIAQRMVEAPHSLI